MYQCMVKLGIKILKVQQMQNKDYSIRPQPLAVSTIIIELFVAPLKVLKV